MLKQEFVLAIVISMYRTKKTVYVLTTPYFRLWYLFVYQSRAELVVGDEELTEQAPIDVSVFDAYPLTLTNYWEYKEDDSMHNRKNTAAVSSSSAAVAICLFSFSTSYSMYWICSR